MTMTEVELHSTPPDNPARVIEILRRETNSSRVRLVYDAQGLSIYVDGECEWQVPGDRLDSSDNTLAWFFVYQIRARTPERRASSA